jgi:uncharacterized membrane protein YidH (DUF202 family)
MPSDDDPEDLDPGLARERTRLAWTRTAIAFAALGAVLLREDPVIGLAVVAASPLVWALGRIAGRSGPPRLRRGRLLLVTVIVTAVALLAAAAALLGRSPGGLRLLLLPHG